MSYLRISVSMRIFCLSSVSLCSTIKCCTLIIKHSWLTFAWLHLWLITLHIVLSPLMYFYINSLFVSNKCFKPCKCVYVLFLICFLTSILIYYQVFSIYLHASVSDICPLEILFFGSKLELKVEPLIFQVPSDNLEKVTVTMYFMRLVYRRTI